MSQSKLLIVDDEIIIQTFLARCLEREGYLVQTASSGQEALKHLAQHSFDLLLTDIKMDKVDGVELLARVKSLWPDIAVILFTGHATVSSAVAALREGAFDYLLKPVKNEDIVEAVKLALEDRHRQKRRDQLENLAGEIADIWDSDRSGFPRQDTHVVCDSLILDTASFQAQLDGKLLSLTPTEFRLLSCFCAQAGQVIDYNQLVQTACGYTCTRREAREIIGTHVRNLRGKLRIKPGQSLYIESIRGVGYRLIPEDIEPVQN